MKGALCRHRWSASYVCCTAGRGVQADLHVIERGRHRLELLLQSSLLIGQPLVQIKVVPGQQQLL